MSIEKHILALIKSLKQDKKIQIVGFTTMEDKYLMEIEYKQTDLSKDLEEIRKSIEDSFASSSDSNLNNWLSFDEIKQMIKIGKGVCIKAVQDEKIVGVVHAQQENPVNGNEGTEKWVIVVISVAPQAKRKGIGSRLLKAIEDIAKAKGVRKMFVFTNMSDEKIREFYQKNGYADAGWIRDYQYGKDNSAVFLLKYL